MVNRNVRNRPSRRGENSLLHRILTRNRRTFRDEIIINFVFALAPNYREKVKTNPLPADNRLSLDVELKVAVALKYLRLVSSKRELAKASKFFRAGLASPAKPSGSDSNSFLRALKSSGLISLGGASELCAPRL
jgi:hypothetical protein